LNPIIDSLNEKIHNFKPTHILIVNYFGWIIQNRAEVFTSIKSPDHVIIEDFAHCILPLVNHELIEKHADFEVFSIHKILGSNSGGALLQNQNLVEIKNTIKKADLLHYAASSLSLVHSKRMQNFEYLLTKLNEKSSPLFSNFFPDMKKNLISPLNYPIKVENRNFRHDLYTKLIEHSIFPTSLYYRLIPQINHSNYPVTWEVSNQILNLPIHQDVTIEELDFMLEIIYSNSKS